MAMGFDLNTLVPNYSQPQPTGPIWTQPDYIPSPVDPAYAEAHPQENYAANSFEYDPYTNDAWSTGMTSNMNLSTADFSSIDFSSSKGKLLAVGGFAIALFFLMTMGKK